MAKFKQGDRVKKKSGSEWQGHIVGWYSTTLTIEGYAVESESHKGSVQIYPASALVLVDDKDALNINDRVRRVSDEQSKTS